MELNVKTIATILSIILGIGAICNLISAVLLMIIYGVTITQLVLFVLVIIPLVVGMGSLSVLLYKIVR